MNKELIEELVEEIERFVVCKKFMNGVPSVEKGHQYLKIMWNDKFYINMELHTNHFYLDIFLDKQEDSDFLSNFIKLYDQFLNNGYIVTKEEKTAYIRFKYKFESNIHIINLFISLR
jgi:hypothetical protein